MEGMSLGGELVLVSACLTVSPLITGGQAHTHTCKLLALKIMLIIISVLQSFTYLIRTLNQVSL
jgi:hypothetical protein